MSLQIFGIVGISAAIASAGATWWVTHDVLTAKHKAQVAQLRADASEAYDFARDQALETERINNAKAQTLELKNESTRKSLDATLAENRRISRELGGMRDPAAQSGCPVPTSPSGSNGPTATTTTGRLSDEAAEFLFAFARDADEAAAYALTCSQFLDGILSNPDR